MKNPLYRKNMMATLSVKPAKAGIRQNLRKQKTLNLGHALVGIGAETGEVITTLRPFISGGSQLTADLKSKARSEFGDVLYFTFLGTKMLKMKVPASTKKVKLKTGTITESLLQLGSMGTDFVSEFKKLYYGLEIDEAAVTVKLEEFIQLLWGVIYTLYNEPPATILEENVAKLSAKYPGQVFTTEAAAAAEAAKKATPTTATAE